MYDTILNYISFSSAGYYVKNHVACNFQCKSYLYVVTLNELKNSLFDNQRQPSVY